MKYKTKVVMTGCVGMAVSVLLLICSLWEQQPLTELSRPGKGADSVTEHLQVQIGEDKTPIDVTVAAVPYDRKEEQTRIREASIEELMQAPSMNRNAAEAVYGFFHKE